jgi:N-methylhydantoinase A/oxoprolinase/acetone carboxylase beta subunit
LSALGLVSADHVVDATRAHLSGWQALDLTYLNALADSLETSARAELDQAGVPEERIDLQWLLNLVYPGQTFDNALPLAREEGVKIAAEDVAACVEEFHRRNEEARLIEARSQEPMVRGIRLVATGRIDRPVAVALRPSDERPVPTAHRRVHLGDEWCDAAVYDAGTLSPGPEIAGPALLASPFTTLTLRPGDVARVLASGDVLVDVAP